MSDRNITHKSNKTKSYNMRQYKYQLTKLSRKTSCLSLTLAELVLLKTVNDLRYFKNPITRLQTISIIYFVVSLSSKWYKIELNEEYLENKNFNFYYALGQLQSAITFDDNIPKAFKWAANLIKCERAYRQGEFTYSIDHVRYLAIEFGKEYYTNNDFNASSFEELRREYLGV